MPSIAIFVDVQNIYYTTRDTFSRQFNYRKLWQQLAEHHDIVHAIAYAIESSNDSQRKFQDALRHIGFEVKLKPYIQRHDGSAKGDWDVGITIDMLELAVDVEHVVLLSGDGDFALLLNKIKEKYQVATHVYGVAELTAQGLINAADRFNKIDADLLI